MRWVPLCLLLLMPASAWSAYSQSDLLRIHQTYLSQTASSMESATLSGDSMNYYFTSIYLMGMLSAVEVTRDPVEFQQALHYIDNMIAHAVTNVYVDARGRQQTRRVWGPLAAGAPVELNNLQGAQPIARAAALIRRIPAFQALYAAKAAAYVAFVDQLIIQRWYVDVYNQNPPWLTGDPPDWGDGQAWNDKAWLLGDIATSLYQASGQPLYAQLSGRVAAGFKKYLQPMGAGWIWNNGSIPIGSDTDNEPGSVGNQAGVPDTAHANRAPMMMVFQYEAGLGNWTSSDIQRLCSTLSDAMWNQSTSNPSISNYVNGSNKPYRVHMQPGENGFIFSGWALCAGYSAKAHDAVFSMLAAVQAGVSNPSVRENSDDYYKTVGLSGHALRSFLKVTPPVGNSRPNAQPSVVPVQAADPSDDVVVRPNPWRSDRHSSLPIIFDHVMAGSEVSIFTLSGQKVRELSATGSSVSWNLLNDALEKVASGLYIYLVKSDTGAYKRGVLAIIK